MRYQDAQIRALEEETEANNPDPVMKKQEESPGSLSMKELAMKLVPKKQKEDSDTPSMKKPEQGSGRIRACLRQINNQNYGNTKEPAATNLEISSKETPTTKK